MGAQCYHEINNLAKKNKHYRNSIKSFLKQNCVPHFNVTNINMIDEAHLEAFVCLIKSCKFVDV